MFISYETHQGFKSAGSSTVKVVSYLLLFIVLFATGKRKRKSRRKLRFYPILQIPGNSVINTTRLQFKETFTLCTLCCIIKNSKKKITWINNFFFNMFFFPVLSSSVMFFSVVSIISFFNLFILRNTSIITSR